MLMCILNRMILGNDLRCCLLADAWNSRNIIGSVTHQRFQIDKFNRIHLIAFFYICRIIIFHFGASLLRLRDSNLHMLCRKLQKISVTGNHRYFHALFFCSSRQRSKQVICLQSRLLDNAHSHRL